MRCSAGRGAACQTSPYAGGLDLAAPRAAHTPQVASQELPIAIGAVCAVHFTWADRRADGAGDVAHMLSKLSDSLATQVYEHIHVPVLRGLRVFQQTDASFLISLCSCLRTRMFSPEDAIIKCAVAACGICRGFCRCTRVRAPTAGGLRKQ